MKQGVKEWLQFANWKIRVEVVKWVTTWLHV